MSHICDSCATIYQNIDDLNPAENLNMRLEPGSIVPSGECPKCGALCYPETSIENQTIIVEMNSGIVEDVYTSGPLEYIIIDKDTDCDDIKTFEGEEIIMERYTSTINANRIRNAIKTLESHYESEEILKGYLVAMLWSETGSENDDYEHLDEKFNVDDIDKDSVRVALNDIIAFMDKARDIFTEAELSDLEQIGHDLLLTRNHHGAGFWDGDYTNGEPLTKLCEEMGESKAYAGDDGIVYIESQFTEFKN